MAGGHGAELEEKFRHFLALEEPHGRVAAVIFGPDNKLIVEIVNNKFTINVNNYFKMERPDFSTMKVVDQYGKEALSIRYMNRWAVRISGRFKYPDFKMLEVLPDRIILGGVVQRGVCIDADIDIDVI